MRASLFVYYSKNLKKIKTQVLVDNLTVILYQFYIALAGLCVPRHGGSILIMMLEMNAMILWDMHRLVWVCRWPLFMYMMSHKKLDNYQFQTLQYCSDHVASQSTYLFTSFKHGSCLMSCSVFLLNFSVSYFISCYSTFLHLRAVAMLIFLNSCCFWYLCLY